MNIYFNAKVILCIFFAFVLSYINAIKIFGFDKDYFWYHLLFEQASNANLLFSQRYEIGFLLFNYVIAILGGGFSTLLFLSVFFTLIIKFKLVWNSNYVTLCILIYLFLLLPVHEMTQIRVAISVAFFYLSVFKIEKGHVKSASLYYIIAISMHVTALIYLPVMMFFLYVKNKRKLNYKFVILFILIFFIVVKLMTSLIYLHPLSNNYLNQKETMSLISPKNIIFIIIAIFYTFNIKYLKRRRFFYFICIYGLIMTEGFSFLGVVANRILEFSYFGFILLCAHKENKTFNSFLFLFLLFMVSIMIFYNGVYLNSNYFSPVFFDPR